MASRGSYNYNQTNIPRNKPWFEKQHKTVNCICLECQKESSVTLYGFPSMWRRLIVLEKCMHCDTVGKLNAINLSKPRKVKSKIGQQPLFK